MKDKTLPLVRSGIALLLVTLLTGCKGVLDPKGQVGVDEKSLIVTATLLMLIVVIPVIVLTLVFAWKYRASNTSSTYAPKWSHSTKIELVVWLIPCLIILALGTVTWKTTHELDPYKPLKVATDTKPLKVEVVSLDWKWLFIYPEQHIATVNKLVIPAHRQIAFDVTSDSVMNSFFIPELGSQIYTMAGMKTKLHLIADHPGVYGGYSANYSGAGFAGMKFDTQALATQADFDKWVQDVRAKGTETLDRARYDELAKRSKNNPVQYFSNTSDGLFMNVVMQYMHKKGGEMKGMDMEKSVSMEKKESPAMASADVKKVAGADTHQAEE